jgi:hypothetical protein
LPRRTAQPRPHWRGWRQAPHYSGFSLGFHLSSITAGGPAPLIATALLAATGSGYVIALYILFCAVVSVITTVFLPDRANRDISEEPAYGAATERAGGT